MKEKFKLLNVLKMRCCTLGLLIAVSCPYICWGGVNNTLSSSYEQSEITIKGQVVDSDDVPLPGVSIIVKNNPTKGVATDFDGNYTINVQKNAVLVFSFLGFNTQEIKASKARNGVLNVTMKADAQELEDVVVTAYGTGQKKVSVVASIETVRPADLKIPSANLSNSFAGKMPGVIAFQRSGMPGADGSNFYIRGISTISGVTNPLILLDGVQISSGDLNTIDPEVIESFSILKDATATALYGSRGANGVMLITTKSGANLDKPKISFRIEANMSQPSKVPKVVGGARFMELFNEAADNLSSGVVRFTEDQIEGTRNKLNPYIYPDIDWYGELFNNVAYNQKVNFNIRGGGKKVDYFMNFNASHETGIIKGISKDYFSFDNNINIKRYTFQNNINAHLGKYSKVTLRLNTQLRDATSPFADANGLFGYSRTANPVDFPIRYPEDPTLDYVKWGAYGGSNITPFNPIAALASGIKRNFQSTVIANLQYDQKLDFLIKGLRFNTLVSFKNWSSTNANRNAPYNMFLLTSYEKNPDGTFSFETGLQGNESAVVLNSSAGSTGDRSYFLQSMLNYSQNFGKHDINSMLIYTQDEYNVNNPSTNESYNTLINSLPKRKQSFAARFSYGFDRRYLFEANVGYNGSENFASGHRFGIFPAVAVGYNVAEEEYFAPLKKYIQFLKFRASWGLVGNDQIGGNRFLYLSKVNLGGVAFTTGRNQDETRKGPSYDRYENINLTWEIAEKLNLGIDLRIFQNLNLKFDLFSEHRSNIFQQRGTIANYLGTAQTKVYGNTAEVKNHGFDMSINFNKQLNNDWYISTQGSFTYAHNEILKFDEPADQDYPNLMNVGNSLHTHLGFISEGYFYDEAEIANRPEQKISSNVAPGDIKYRDIPNKDGIADGEITNNDKVRMGYPTVPEITYGFGVNAKYKNWDAGVYFHGNARTSLLMSGFHPFGTNSRNNVLEWIADDHWSPHNQNLNAVYPRLTKDDHGNNTAPSTHWLRDASFIKLKNAEIGYTYKNMRFYLQGTNLFTISKFKLWDPEQGGGSGLKYPLQRVINIGFQMSIN